MMKMGKKLLTFTLAAFTLTALSGCGKENIGIFGYYK